MGTPEGREGEAHRNGPKRTTRTAKTRNTRAAQGGGATRAGGPPPERGGGGGRGGALAVGLLGIADQASPMGTPDGVLV